ncbi:MAG TPA: sensor domain-containing protein [Aldersonia sp.]
MGRVMLLAAGVAVLCGVAACAAEGCGSSSDADSGSAAMSLAPVGPAVAAPDPPTGPPFVDADRLHAALLDPTDLPAGFAELADPEELGLPSSPVDDAPDRSGTTPSDCADVLAPIGDQAPGSLAAAIVRYGGPGFSSVDADAASYSEAAVGHVFTAVQELLAGCESYSGTDADGVVVEYRVGGLDLSGVESNTIGDASTSVRVATTSEGFTLVSDVVIGVVGSTVFAVSATRDTPFDPAFVTELGRVQAERLRGTLGP